jgi:hypothetical protein
MEAIRKKKIKREGRKVVIELPEDFTAEEVEVIVWPSENESKSELSDEELNAWKKQMSEFYSKFNVDLSGFKFNRDELYDRP